ncbi:hypothetical protein [Lysobacter gummosus]|uniref:hypothetical protein n=1 Tax=Lysobacter gummosus TaxID=262324 RepID=UPI00362872DB
MRDFGIARRRGVRFPNNVEPRKLLLFSPLRKGLGDLLLAARREEQQQKQIPHVRFAAVRPFVKGGNSKGSDVTTRREPFRSTGSPFEKGG